MTGDNVTFSSTSSGIVTISAAVVPNSVDVTGSYTFSGSGKITGITAVTVQSPAALVIANTNDYTGGTNIQGGTISLGTNNGLPIAGTLTFGSGTSNGTFDLAGHNQQLAGLITAAAATSNQIVTASTGSSTLNYAGGSNYSQFLGSITDMAPSGGTLGLTISSGTLDMTSGTTNYFGATTITGSGVLLAGSIPNTSSISVASAGTLSIAVANASYAQSFSNSGNVVFGNTSGTITLSNPTGSGTTSANGATLNVPAGASGLRRRCQPVQDGNGNAHAHRQQHIQRRNDLRSGHDPGRPRQLAAQRLRRGRLRFRQRRQLGRAGPQRPEHLHRRDFSAQCLRRATRLPTAPRAPRRLLPSAATATRPHSPVCCGTAPARSRWPLAAAGHLR